MEDTGLKFRLSLNGVKEAHFHTSSKAYCCYLQQDTLIGSRLLDSTSTYLLQKCQSREQNDSLLETSLALLFIGVILLLG